MNQSSEKSAPPEHFLNGKKILFIDDEVDLVEILSERFQLFGAITSVASSVEEALKKLTENQYDLIISDMQMPGGSGIDIFNKMQNKEGSKAVKIIVTGHADLSHEEIYDRGIDAIFTKPFQLKDLVSAVGFLLEKPENRWSRKHERISCDAELTIRLESIESAVLSKMVNIGRGGMSLQVPSPPPHIGQVVHFAATENLASKFDGHGICRWVNFKDGIFYIGLEFTELSKETIDSILGLIKQKNPVPYIPKV